MRCCRDRQPRGRGWRSTRCVLGPPALWLLCRRSVQTRGEPPPERRAVASTGAGREPISRSHCPERLRPEFLVPAERATGIEPAFSAWEADVLPLNYARE